MKIKLHTYLSKTEVDGPGVRIALWVQGCKKHCRGCMMESTWDYNGGFEEDTNKIVQRIKDTTGIEGVTFLGGEPFDQAKAVYEIGYKAKSFGLSIITFTGYLKEEIEEMKDEYCNKLMGISDILIDGPFQEDRKDYKRPWVGSSNQRYFFMTDRYRNIDLDSFSNKIEVRLNENGTILVNGMGDFGKFIDLLDNV